MDKFELKEMIISYLKKQYRKTLENATKDELYQAVVFAVKDIINDKWIRTYEEYNNQDSKIVYYLSMEFLMGRFLGNSLINLSMDKIIKEVFDEFGIDYNAVEDAEPDPGLGNGGLGRLAACFLDSLTTLSLPAYGCGIRYHYGIFKQTIENGYQIEKPDNWLENGDPWSVKLNDYTIEVKFGGTVRAVPKDNGVLNVLSQQVVSNLL